MSRADDTVRRGRTLLAIRTIHTFFWALFAGAIVAVLIATAFGRLTLALWLSGLVWIECLVLFVNAMRCPLTGIAARYTEDRADNFDIFLPAWLARYNKLIFGTLFAIAEIFLIVRLVAG